MSNYDDIINLPHHVSQKHPQMSMRNRAAQFSPFAALTGYDAAIRESARLTERKIELGEDEKAEISEKLRHLKDSEAEHPVAVFTYFVPDDRKDGGMYVTLTVQNWACRYSPIAKPRVSPFVCLPIWNSPFSERCHSRFLQIPSRGGHPCLWLNTLPATERVVVFHRLVVAHARRTTRQRAGTPARHRIQFSFNSSIWSFHRILDTQALHPLLSAEIPLTASVASGSLIAGELATFPYSAFHPLYSFNLFLQFSKLEKL